MNTIQRIAKNTAALFAAQFIVAILGLVLSIVIARSLGDVIFGKFSFASNDLYKVEDYKYTK